MVHYNNNNNADLTLSKSSVNSPAKPTNLTGPEAERSLEAIVSKSSSTNMLQSGLLKYCKKWFKHGETPKLTSILLCA